MHTTSLREFIEIVPVCALTASLSVVLKLFRRTPFERLLVLDEQATPIGVFNACNLVPYLFSSTSDNHSSTLKPNSPHPISTLQLMHLPIDPVETVSDEWDAAQICAHLQSKRSPYWVVVNRFGACLGLLNPLWFWQRGSIYTERTSAPQPSPSPLGSLTDPSFEISLKSKLFLQLVQVLEQLPIPLMLQTEQGRVLSQNLAWRQQIGELRDLSTVQREAALFLATLPTVSDGVTALESFMDASSIYADLSSSLQSKTLLRSPDLEFFQSDLYLLGNVSVRTATDSVADPEKTQLSTVCHLGTNSNTCVCVCSMKNGQERVWQFMKIPIGTATHQANTGWTIASTPDDPSLTLAQFQLASLETTSEQIESPGIIAAIAASEPLWLVQAQDTTEQQQVAKELAAKNADLIQLNRLKDEFLACISHELKTPLTSVLGLSSLLKDQLLGPLNERQARYAQLIYQGGRHLILIVNDILDLTRIETGQLELIPEPVNIEVVCRRAFEQARQLLLTDENSNTVDTGTDSPFDISFSLDIEPTLSTFIADELRLRQMIVNLLSNALKFTEAGGKVGLRVALWEGWIAFTVWDTGIGIPSNKQHLIFQKFQQLENPLTRRFEGTGLGLVLTQRLARLHGGDVTFTSIEGKGSEFTLLLPPSPPHLPQSNTPQEVVKPTPVVSNKRLVMVVEAAPKLLEDLTQQLAGLGYRVAIARSGTEALEKIRRLQPAVVFLNPVLPLLSGWDVLTLLKSDNEMRHIPIVMTATHAEKSQAYSNGANSFLSLPIQPNALQHSLDYWVDRPSQIESSETQMVLTVLHLHLAPDAERSDSSNSRTHQPLITDLNSLLHPYHCRVLQVDDLDQADLLVRVWKPDLMLLDGITSDPLHYLTQLSQFPFLAALPLVTLTPEMTQAANQIPGLMVFPCLASLELESADLGRSDASALWQVMQIAVGTHWTSHVLVADLATLPFDLSIDPRSDAIASNTARATHHALTQPTCFQPGLTYTSTQKVNEWLQVLLQYLQTAGFRSSLGRSWSDVLQQMKHGGVDLLLLCVHPTEFQALKPAIQALAQLDAKPPILIWNCCSSLPNNKTPGNSAPNDPALVELVGAIATRILPSSLTMQDLLSEINQALVM